MIEKETLKKEISQLLAGADLNAITSKKVRKELEQRLGVGLGDRKKEVDELIASVLQEAADSDSSEAPEPRPQPQAATATATATATANGDGVDGSSSSSDEEVDASLRVGDGARRPTDEEIARQLHERENGLPRRRAAAQGAGAGSSKQKRRRTESPAGAGQRQKSTAFSRPCLLSDALASVVGCDTMPRHQVVKRLWEIARDREMFDPKNKQFVICDPEFERLFGKKRVRMFGAMKYLKSHIRPVEEA